MEKRIFTVTQINNMVKTAIEANLPSRLSVAGEISSYRPNAGGHKYFTIKDEHCQIPAVMWRSAAAKSKFEIANGIAVIATGFVDVYPPYGKYQLIVDTINPAGVGDLRLMFERLVARLTDEGLFNAEHKKPLPKYPMRIGIVTSATGAAVQDITDSIRRRFPCAKMLLYPVPVQGKGAEVKIAAAINDINARNNELRLDLMIVGRGGGSLEDLWCFNEEVVARAIFASKVPLISAVGHEIDTTIADLVADERASTPTRAGVIAVPDMADLNDQIDAIDRRLRHDVANKINFSRQHLATILASSAFRNPGYLVGIKSQRLDEMQWRLKDAFGGKLAWARAAVDACRGKVEAVEPHNLLGKKNLELQRFESRLAAAFNENVNKARLSLTAAQNRLQTLDPRSVLNRGYSITRDDKSGKILTGGENLTPGDTIKTEFADKKQIRSRVE
jgi:exodeoxyribonuclease VII large subunit